MIKAVEWVNGKVRLIDQTKLPGEEIYVECTDYRDVASAIKNMIVRGAPAIGVTSALGIALGIRAINSKSKEYFFKEMEDICNIMAGTRPTAINLFWAIKRMKDCALKNREREIEELKDIIEKEALNILIEDMEINRQIGKRGQVLIPEEARILTHCNAMSLATSAYGTVGGIILFAFESGKKIHVYAGETRPFLQGARLTCWELKKEGIPVTLITDSMAGYIMKNSMVDIVIVGADRIAANGDVANKIGTYGLSILAKEHSIPFYVAAPISTLDLNIKTGDEIPIEHRDVKEVTHISGIRIAPEGVPALNPAFDVTPNRYINAIVTERGIAYPPFNSSLKNLADPNLIKMEN